MYKLFFVLVGLLFMSTTKAQTFDVDTLLWNGDINKRVNLVILGDGYQQSEMTKFATDANNFMTDFFLASPFKEYKNYFNVLIIKVPSVESGADHPGTATDVSEPAHPVSSVNTYFGARFDAFNIHRLLVCNNSVVNTVLANNFPLYDQALVIVNSPHYGGSGGAIAVTSADASSAQIAIHEIGHSFGYLKDEYYAGDVYAAEAKNMTQETNPVLVKWKNWHGTNNIGIYQHCCGGNSSAWYRPNQNCKMRYLSGDFCSVCSEGLVEEIHDLSTSINSYLPNSTNLNPSIFPIDFSVDLTHPLPNTLNRIWNLNNNATNLGVDVDSVQVLANDLNIGANSLIFYATDTTSLLRVDNHIQLHVEYVTWNINYIASGIQGMDNNKNKIDIDIYPNPTTDLVNIRMNDQLGEDSKIELYDISGKLLTKIEKKISTTPDEIIAINLKQYDSNLFLLKIYIKNQLVSTQKIVKI